MDTRRVGRRFAFGLVLAAAMGLFLSADAQAQTARLETVFNALGRLWARGSIDGGATWTPFVQLPETRCNGTLVYFDGAPAIVSDQAGRLLSVAVSSPASGGSGLAGSFFRDGQWSCWNDIWLMPDVHNPGPRYTYRLSPGTSVALTSWGPGDFSMYLTMTRSDGAITVLHQPVVENRAGRPAGGFGWEFLGIVPFSGTPAVTSWGPGRIDLFVRTANNGLVHKWFENGHWSSGWEDMDASIMSSPSVASAAPGHLDVYAIGTDRALWHRWFSGNVWSEWVSLGGVLGLSTEPAATSRGVSNMDIFVYASDRQTVFQRTYHGPFWSVAQNSFWTTGHAPMAAAYWDTGIP